MTDTNPWFLGAVALGCFAFSTPVFADLSVGNYALQNVTRVSRYEFDYRYTATVTNTGGETAKGVTARVSSVNPSLVIIDGEVTFGDVAGGATVTSSDTFTVRHDRRQGFAREDLQWSVVLSWSPSSLSQMLSAGQSVTITATFTASENAQSVTVRVAPEIAPYVTVSPSSFANIIRGASYPVAVTFAAAADALTGLYDGVIDLQQGGGTLGQSLMVEVAIDGVSTVVHDPEGGIYSVNEIELSLVDGATLDDAQRLAELVHGKILESFPDTNTYFLLVPTQSILELQNTIRLLEADPKVKFATTNELMNLYGITTDLQHLREQNPSSSYTEAYDQIAVEKAWELVNDAGILPKKIDIGIVDTGIDASHPEFDASDYPQIPTPC